MPLILGILGQKGAGKDTAAQPLLDLGWHRQAFATPLYEEVAHAFQVALDLLQHRKTKESPRPELALQHCRDLAFVQTALAAIGVAASLRRALHHPPRTPRAGIRRRLKKALTAPRSPRLILQLWGTEFRRRHFGEDYFTRQVASAILAAPCASHVITDVRTLGEARLIERLGGVLLRVVRPSQSRSGDATLTHATETALLQYPVSAILENHDGPKGRDALHAAMRQLVHALLSKAA